LIGGLLFRIAQAAMNIVEPALNRGDGVFGLAAKIGRIAGRKLTDGADGRSRSGIVVTGAGRLSGALAGGGG